MILTAAYCRVSTSGEDQANSFEAQKRFFSSYISSRSDLELYRIYADEGISGTAFEKRWEFQRMMSDASRGLFQLVLTKEVSRFSRNLLDTIACTRELKRLGVGVVFMNDGINSLDTDAELRLSIMASLAQEESRRTSERVKWGQQRQMERGVVFGHSLLGYTVKNGVLSIEPFGAEIVRQIFEKYAAGYSSGTIAKMLNEKGCYSSTGAEWTAATVLKILKNEKYMGDLIQKKSCTPSFLDHKKIPNKDQESMVYIENHHDAIIDRGLWDTVQHEIIRRRRKKHTSAVSEKSFLSGKIICGECGSAFVSRKKTAKSGIKYRRWCCAASLRSEDACTFHAGLRDEQINAMLSMIKHDIKDELYRACFMGTSLHSQKRKQDIEILIEKIEHKKSQALDFFLSGLLDINEFDNIKRKYDMQLSSLAESMRHHPDDSAEASLLSAAKALLASDRADESFWRIMLDRIVFCPDNTVKITLKGCEWIYEFKKD